MFELLWIAVKAVVYTAIAGFVITMVVWAWFEKLFGHG